MRKPYSCLFYGSSPHLEATAHQVEIRPNWVRHWVRGCFFMKGVRWASPLHNLFPPSPQ